MADQIWVKARERLMFGTYPEVHTFGETSLTGFLGMNNALGSSPSLETQQSSAQRTPAQLEK
jgi:hypothetical protein